MFGSKLTSIRLARGYSQSYMAKKIGIAQNSYSKIESNAKVKVSDDLLKKIAEVLGVSIEDIKSPTLIVMNFDSQAKDALQEYSHLHDYMDSRIIENLIMQLAVKDKQISEKDKQINELLIQVKK
ncbi:MAG: DUF536 domain-containing protein [Bacteroidetes bacterium]|jgi:putative transcriptional regulator|nr:DUF536 domain-containing protein [Bacteroidota bacterium]